MYPPSSILHNQERKKLCDSTLCSEMKAGISWPTEQLRTTEGSVGEKADRETWSLTLRYLKKERKITLLITTKTTQALQASSCHTASQKAWGGQDSVFNSFSSGPGRSPDLSDQMQGQKLWTLEVAPGERREHMRVDGRGSKWPRWYWILQSLVSACWKSLSSLKIPPSVLF